MTIDPYGTRPSRELEALEAKVPASLWEFVELLVLLKGRENFIDWPSWCFLPMSGWYELGEKFLSDTTKFPEIINPTCYISALGTWRYSRGYYIFDDDLYDELTMSQYDGAMPSSALLRLPEYCLYVNTPWGIQFFGSASHGFWMHLEYEPTSPHNSELRILIDHGDKIFVPITIRIGNWSIGAAVDKSVRSATRPTTKKTMREFKELFEPSQVREMSESMSHYLQSVMPLVLHLCGDRKNLTDRSVPHGERPEPNDAQKHQELMVPKPRIWHAGNNK
ncbi:MAG: hypothetical protein LBE84_04800 [Planctomycetota bacterium]|jgi:hypothetical protein|nr:hypothetical protein [Planctomycetota bacterium]